MKTYEISVCPKCEGGPLYMQENREGMYPRDKCPDCDTWVVCTEAVRLTVEPRLDKRGRAW